MQNNNSAGVSAGLPFVIIKDGHGNEHKVIDLSNRDICPREGLVAFEATTRKNSSRANEFPFKACKDKLTGVWIGICTGINPLTKNLQWLPITLDKYTMFNLEIEDEAMKVACLLRSNIVLESPNCSSNIKLGLFRVHDENKAAALNIERINNAQRALEIVKGLYGENLKDMARNMGINTDHTNDTILLSELMSRAEKNPTELLRVYDNPNRENISIFHKGVSLGVIRHDPTTGYYYRDVFMVINENYVCVYLTKYKDIATSISTVCKEKEQQSKQSNRRLFTDPEKDALLKRIAELEAAQKDVPTQNLEKELAEAIAEAKSIGGNMAKGLEFYKPTRESIDKLKAKIDEHNKVTQ